PEPLLSFVNRTCLSGGGLWPAAQTVDKALLTVFRLSKKPALPAFSARTRFPCALGAAGETRRETLLRKASEPAAHAAGFGFQLEGFGPPNLPQGIFGGSGLQ